MAPTLLYLLKANVALFAAAYYRLRRGLTFFRQPGVPGIRAAVCGRVPSVASAGAAASGVDNTAGRAFGAGRGVGADHSTAAAIQAFGRQAVGLAAYALSTGLLMRLLGRLASLAWVRCQSRPAMVLGPPVRLLAGEGGPFSFGQTIHLSASALAYTASCESGRGRSKRLRVLVVWFRLLAALAPGLTASRLLRGIWAGVGRCILRTSLPCPFRIARGYFPDDALRYS